MDTLTRRRFLVASGVTGATALAGGSSGVLWHQLHQRATDEPLSAGTPVLVVLTLYGGNDGLNTVVPYADAAYHDARPDLAYAAGDVLHLDDQLGLNPAMTGLAALWKRKQLAVVRGVGYPKPDHSHFRSMDIWQTASPEAPVSTGWIGRWLDATGDDPLRAVNIGSVLPPLAVGSRATAAALPLQAPNPPSPATKAAYAALGRPDPADSPDAALVAASYRDAGRVDTTFTPVLHPVGGAAESDHESPGGSAGGQGDLARQLDVVARCVKAGVPTRVYSVSLGGFDTHADEKGTQKTQLGVLDAGVSRFLADLAGDERGRGVALLVYSEFGRRVAANASQGTDHGTAGPVLVAGPGVRGGLYGEQPSLTDLDDGDLKASTDFRVVYGELLHRVLGAEPARILGQERPYLGFMSA